MPDAGPQSTRARFVAELIQNDGRLAARDRWRPDAPEIPFAGDGEPGSFVEVTVKDGHAHSVGEWVAPAGSALATLVRIAADHGLDPTFAPSVTAEVDAILADGSRSAPSGTDDPSLEDMSALPFVTIDNEGSRDLDQALCIELSPGGYRVLYALADAAYYVKRGGPLFEESLARAASYYLPGWMVPMLPRALSEGIVSLNPNVKRRALVFDMRLDRDGTVSETRVVRAHIESRAKLTYEGVQAFLDAPDKHAFAREPFGESLRLLREVGERRIAVASAHDVVHYRRRTVEVSLDGTRSFVLYSGLRNPTELYNEQLSLLCNMEGARLLRDALDSPTLQAVFRVHPAPPEDRVRGFSVMVGKLAALHGRGDDPRWSWDAANGESLARFLDGLPVEGDGARLARAIQRQAIMMNVRSTFTDAVEEHHGVGAEAYARFSSPMREVVGVFLHGELVEQLGGPGHDPEKDRALRLRVIEAANRAKTVQRQLTELGNRLALDQLFGRDVALPRDRRPLRRGTVMGVSGSKLYLSLDEPAIDVKLYRGDLERAAGAKLRLGDGELTFERPDGSVAFRVGDAIDVRTERRDERRDRWVLAPAS